MSLIVVGDYDKDDNVYEMNDIIKIIETTKTTHEWYIFYNVKNSDIDDLMDIYCIKKFEYRFIKDINNILYLHINV